MPNPVIRKQKFNASAPTAQPIPIGYDYESIDSASVPTPPANTLTVFRDTLDGELKTKDENGVISPLGSGGGGGLQPNFIDHTNIPSELVRNRIYEADFSGATAGSTLTVTFPEGVGTETFIIGFRITGLSENSSVTFQTTNSQNIFFPDATTDTSLTGVNTPTYLEFAWDQSRYVYGDVYDPTYIDARGLFENDDQVLTEAGEISSTSQDTSLWPDVNGNKVKKGKLALSTSASTTITNAQTVYPELWANAPAAWQSGSDLVVPPMGGNTIGHWESFDPTSLTAMTTNVTWTGLRRRNGINLEMQIYGDITGVPSGDSIFTFGFPSDVTVSQSDILNTSVYDTVIGNGGCSDGSTRTPIQPRFFLNAGTPLFRLVALNTATPSLTTGQIASPTFPYTFGSGDRIWFSVSIPVEEYKDQTPTISLYNNLVPTSLTIDLPEATSNVEGATKRAFFLAQAGASQTITGSLSTLNLDPPLINEGFTVSGANNETITVNNAGVYKISAHVTFNLLATTEAVRIEIYAGGIRKSSTRTGAPDGSAIVSAVSFTMAQLNANDTIEIYVIMASGSATTLTSRNDYTQVTIERMNA
jgi:hypothetical protein